jgi:hypothetical protein
MRGSATVEMRESTARGNIAVPMALRRSRGGLDLARHHFVAARIGHAAPVRVTSYIEDGFK